jgi:colanic acid/amylovoran biosynthesis glycosyltransferase
MSRFPHLPETFILREMNELEQLGWQVALYPLILQEQAVVHADAQRWIPRARHAPFVSPQIALDNARTFLTQPARLASLWAKTLWENRTSPNFLLRAAALLPKAVTLASQMQAEGVTHIHAHYATHPALMAWLIHRLTGISYSITVHAHDIFVRTEMLPTKLSDAAFIVAISEYNREYLARIVGPWVRNKIHIVHCGIEPTAYEPHTIAPAEGQPFEIITTGSLQPYKGQSYLIEACARLRDRGLPFRCRIIGGGEEREALENLITTNNLANHVELLGPKKQDEVAALLATAHCYVQPSIITPSGKMEGIPVALMEAMASGLPVVATSISGIPELVRPGETGLLVPPADVPALADALAAVYADPAGSAQRAEAGRELVLREFELRSNVAHLATLFEGMVARKPRPAAGAVRLAGP